MATLAAETFIVIFPNFWGKGSTIAEATKNAKDVRGGSRKKSPAIVIAVAAPRDKVTVTGAVDVSVQAPTGTVMMRWVTEL